MSGVQLQGVLTAFCLSPLPSLLLANPAVKGQGKSIHGTATLANTGATGAGEGGYVGAGEQRQRPRAPCRSTRSAPLHALPRPPSK